MSVNNPNFPTGQGERRIEESKIQKTVAIGLPSSLSSAAVYQIPKTLTRHIAPLPNTQMTAISKTITAVHTLQKKDLQKIPLSLTSTVSVTTLQSGTALSNIIPVQISATTPSAATSSALHAPNASNIIRAAHLPGSTHSVAFSHLPRGVVAASAHVRTGTAIAVQKPVMPTTMQTSALGLQGQIRNVLPQMMHPSVTPTTTIRPMTTVSVAGPQATETHRASIPLHNVSSVGNTSSIQITLPASRVQGDLHGKGTTMHQPGKVHLNQTLNMTTQQPKAIMTHDMTPLLQQTLAAKGNRGQPVGQSAVSVTVALSTTTVTIPIISSSSTSTTIPIAKVPPQRQTHIAQSGHTLPATTMPSTTLDHCTESSSFPQPLPAHAHSTSSTQEHSLLNTAHGQSSNSLFMPPYRGAMPIVTSVISSVGHTEGRTEQTISPMTPFLPPLMLSPENPYYHQLMRRQVAAVAQGRQQQALLPSQAAVNMTALSQAVTEATVVSSIRFNHPLMVLPQSRQSTQLQTVPGQFHASSTASDGVNKVMTSPVPMIMTGLTVTTVPQVASSMQTTATQSHNAAQISQPRHSAPSATPVTNSNSSPRPSILRKRTLNEGSAVKKQLLNSLEVHSPRPDPRVDSTPQSNMSSPKTPASGESQSSTDTALSSEATTPTQAPGDSRVKQEPQENGFGNTPEASPRKRRKQLLQANEELRDTQVSVSVFDRLVEACVKEDITEEDEEEDEDEEMDDFDVDDLLSDDEKPDMREEYIDEDGIRWTLEKCRPNLAPLNFYNISWKPRNNHFIRYTDVKPKDERRPTINELSNQKGVLQKTSGWKLYHMAAQIEDLVELELELKDKLSGLQAAMGPDPPVRHSLMEDESSMLHELTQGNIQRCKLITDQLNDAMTQMLNVLDHKPKVSEIISKHMSKRPIKKKERT